MDFNLFAFNVGVMGLAGSGKDTVGDILAESLYAYNKISFAEKLKAVCQDLGWDGNKDDRGRALLQTVGMALRIYDPEAWVKILTKKIDPYKRYVFTDVRFKNEADYIRKNGGIVLKIVRPSLELSETHKHISEAGQSEITPDYEVVNDGTIEDLKVKIYVIIYEETQKRKQKIMGFTSYLEYENKRLNQENAELRSWLNEKKEELLKALKDVEDCLSNELSTSTEMCTLINKLSKTEKQRNIAMTAVKFLRKGIPTSEEASVFEAYDKMLEELKSE
jgi:hypothetical protein